MNSRKLLSVAVLTVFLLVSVFSLPLTAAPSSQTSCMLVESLTGINSGQEDYTVSGAVYDLNLKITSVNQRVNVAWEWVDGQGNPLSEMDASLEGYQLIIRQNRSGKRDVVLPIYGLTGNENLTDGPNFNAISFIDVYQCLSIPGPKEVTLQKEWLDEDGLGMTDPGLAYTIEVSFSDKPDDPLVMTEEDEELVFYVNWQESFTVTETSVPEGYEVESGEGTFSFDNVPARITVENKLLSDSTSGPDEPADPVLNADSLQLTSLCIVEELAETQTRWRIINDAGVDVDYTFEVYGNAEISGNGTVGKDHTFADRFDNPHIFFVDAVHPVTVIIRWGDEGQFSDTKASGGEICKPSTPPEQPGNGGPQTGEPDNGDPTPAPTDNSRGGIPPEQIIEVEDIADIPDEDVALVIPEDIEADVPEDEAIEIDVVEEEVVIEEEQTPLELPKTGTTGGGLMTIPLLLTLSGYWLARKKS